MKCMRVMQYLEATWVELIKIEIVLDDPEADEAEAIEDAQKLLRDMIFDHDKVTVYNNLESVIFNRQDGPVRIDTVFVDDENEKNYEQV